MSEWPPVALSPSLRVSLSLPLSASASLSVCLCLSETSSLPYIDTQVITRPGSGGRGQGGVGGDDWLSVLSDNVHVHTYIHTAELNVRLYSSTYNYMYMYVYTCTMKSTKVQTLGEGRNILYSYKGNVPHEAGKFTH